MKLRLLETTLANRNKHLYYCSNNNNNNYNNNNYYDHIIIIINNTNRCRKPTKESNCIPVKQKIFKELSQ